MKKILFSIAISLLAAGKVCAQSTCQATIPPVPADGYYAIDLPFEIAGRAQEDFADLRIKDNEGREVAWLLREDNERKYTGGFEPFPIEIESVGKATNVWITTDSRALSSFTLRMKNADADKKATLQGSNDRKNWYAVKDRLSLVNTISPDQTEVDIRLDFPLSDYRYYKLAISDSLSAPLNITAVGVVKGEYLSISRSLEVPVKELKIHTQGKQTDILLVFPAQIKVADIAFHISSPTVFQRYLKLWLPVYHQSSRRRGLLKSRRQTTWQETSMQLLSSDNSSPQTVRYGQSTDTLRMTVYNKDDQPLQFDSIKVYTQKCYVVVALKQGVNYQLTCGDPEASFPDYDLSFTNHLPDSLAHLTLSNIKHRTEVPETESAGWEMLKKYGIWVVIVLVILQLLYIIRRMVKQKS